MQEVEQHQQRGQNNLPKDILEDIAEMENAQKYVNPVEAYKTLAYSFQKNNAQGTVFYENAFQKLASMLASKEPLNLQKAVYWVENAYYENTLPYQDFTASLKEMAYCIQQRVKLPATDISKNVAIYSFMTDTLQCILPTGEKVAHFPFVYDFEDYKGEKDYSKMFVTKAMATNSGQCHSLPLLYLVLAEELKTKAWLSYAPNHTFIKFVVNGKIQNYETTNGHLISDALVMQSGFIRAEALANKTYLDTLSKQQLIAHCLMDLGMGYQHKYGFDDFSVRCVDLVLKYYPHNVSTLMTKSNYCNALLQYVSEQSKAKRLPKANMQDIPQVMEIYHKMKQAQQELESIGFAEMPEEVYQNWLAGVKKEAEKQAKTKK